MNQVKTGNFIAKCRKENKLTQNGKCLPDSSLYESICNILGITINELFTGQRIKDEDYKKIADDNLMQM